MSEPRTVEIKKTKAVPLTSPRTINRKNETKETPVPVIETPKIKRQLFPEQTPARQLLQPQNKSEKISVYLRMKPLSSNDIRAISKVDDNTVEVTTQSRVSVAKERYEPKGDKYYFDHVFDENIDQNTIFKKTTLPLVESFFEGTSCLVFSYGVTNAGKTYTVLGSPQNPGIIPKTLSVAFSMLKTLNESEDQFHFEVTYVEVYNDNVYDLLCDQKSTKEKLQLVDQNGMIVVKGANNIRINDTKEASDLLTQGTKNRSIAQTNLNRDSSRSHSVFTIRLIKENETNETFSQLAIVDLAGSERKQRTQASGDRLREAININQSLTTLGRCLNILKLNQFSKNPQQVPYRDSKLTRMFQDMISEGKVVMIVNASPSESDVEENSYILKYAAIASKINTGSKIDTKLDVKKTTTSKPFHLQTASKTPRSSVLKSQNPSELQIQNELTLELKVRQNVSKDMEKSFKELEETFLLNLEQTNSIYEKKYEQKLKNLKSTYEKMIVSINKENEVQKTSSNVGGEGGDQWRLEELTEECKNLRKEISNERNQFKEITNELQSQIYEDKSQLQKFENEIEDQKAEYEELRIKYENERHAWSKQTKNLQIEFERVEDRNHESLNHLNKELMNSKESNKKIKEENAKLLERIAELEKKMNEKSSSTMDKVKQLFTPNKKKQELKSKSQPALNANLEDELEIQDEQEEEEEKQKSRKRLLTNKKNSDSKRKKYESNEEFAVIIEEKEDVFNYEPSPEQRPTTTRMTRSRAKNVNYDEEDYVEEEAPKKKTSIRTRKLIKKKK